MAVGVIKTSNDRGFALARCNPEGMLECRMVAVPGSRSPDTDSQRGSPRLEGEQS